MDTRLDETARPPDTAAASASVVREVLATLNGLVASEISRLHRDVDGARAALASIGQDELAARLAEGQARLRAGDAREFRRAISNVTARLGHLK